jgi:hypothetical protein
VNKRKESIRDKEKAVVLLEVTEEMWGFKGIWFWHRLTLFNVRYNLVDNNILGKTLPASADRALVQFWCKTSEDLFARWLLIRSTMSC